jgi:predicted GNAT family acetyltransferase
VIDAIRNNVALGRFEADVEGGTAFANYRVSAGTITILHTEVPRSSSPTAIASLFSAGRSGTDPT